MAAISLKIPDDLARASKEIADKIGITQTEFIRQALRHELAEIEARLEREAMAAALEKMRDDPAYHETSREFDEGLAEPLSEEPDNWWAG